MLDKLKNKYIFYTLRAFCIFILFCTVSTVSGFYMRDTAFLKNVRGFWNEQLYFQVNFFYSLPIFFSLASIFCLNNTDVKKSFANGNQASGKCGFIVKSKCFWLECAVIGVCSVLFSVVSPFNDLAFGYFEGYSLAESRLIAVAILLPTLIVLNFLAYLSTLIFWKQQGKNLKAEEKSRFSRWVIQLLLAAVAWVFGGFALSVVFPVLVSVLYLLGVFKIPLIIIFVAVVVALFGRKYWIILNARRTFIKKLRHICKVKGLDMCVNGHPYKAAFSPDEGCHLLIYNSKIKIACRLISAPIKKTPLYLNEDGIATYMRERVVFKHHISEKYFFDADEDAQKMIIVCPCRSNIFIKNEHTENLVDMGDKMMEYRIYNASGFINGIERDIFNPRGTD